MGYLRRHQTCLHPWTLDRRSQVKSCLAHKQTLADSCKHTTLYISADLEMQPPPGFGYPQQQMHVGGMNVPPGFPSALSNQQMPHASLTTASHGSLFAAVQSSSKPRGPPPGFDGVAAAHQHSSGLTAGHVDAAAQQYHAPLPPHLHLLHQQHASQHSQQQHGPLPPQLMAHGLAGNSSSTMDRQQAAMNQHAVSSAPPTSGPSSNSGSAGGGGLFALLAKHRADDAEQTKRASETGSAQLHPPMSAAGSGPLLPPMSAAGSGQLPQGIASLPAQHMPPPGSAALGMPPAAVSLQHPGAPSSMGYPADAFAPHPAAAGLGGPMQLPPGVPPLPHMMHPRHLMGPPGSSAPPPGWQPPHADSAAPAAAAGFGHPMGAHMGPPGSMPPRMPPPEFLQGSMPIPAGPMPGPMHMPAQEWGPQGPVSGRLQPPPGWAGPAAAGPGSGHFQPPPGWVGPPLPAAAAGPGSGHIQPPPGWVGPKPAAALGSVGIPGSMPGFDAGAVGMPGVPSVQGPPSGTLWGAAMPAPAAAAAGGASVAAASGPGGATADSAAAPKAPAAAACPTQRQQQQQQYQPAWSSDETAPAAPSAGSVPEVFEVDSSGFGGSDDAATAVLAKRRYLYASGPVCFTCGEFGHEGTECEAPYCSACDLFGHEQGHCRSACSTCGSHHEAPKGRNCRQPRCGECKLWGHESGDCFLQQCSFCQWYGHTDKDCPGYCRYCHEPGHESDNCPIKRCSLCREQGHRWQDCPTHVQDAFADGRALPWQLQAAAQHGGADQQHQGVSKGSHNPQHSKAGGSSRGDRGAGSSSRGRGGQRARNPNENSFDVLM